MRSICNSYNLIYMKLNRNINKPTKPCRYFLFVNTRLNCRDVLFKSKPDNVINILWTNLCTEIELNIVKPVSSYSYSFISSLKIKFYENNQ